MSRPMQRSTVLRLFAPLAALLLSHTALASPTASQALRQESENRAREELGDLLRALCPEQCVLLSLQAKVEEEQVGEVAPGFEAVSPGASVPVLRGLDASVLVDAQLPSSFRVRLKTLAAERLKSLGVTAKVSIESVPFPPRNAPHLQAPERPTAPPPPTPAPETTPESPPPASEPSAPDEALHDQLLAAAPLLAVVALLALTLLLLGGMLVLAVRRQPSPADYFLPEPPAQAPPAATSSVSDAGNQHFAADRLRRLERQLVEDRSLRARVVREALARGEVAAVAGWVRVLGEFLLEDLRGDASMAGPLAALAQELVKPAQQDDGASMAELQGRVIATRLSRAPETAEESFDFLEGVTADRFIGAVKGLSPRALEVAVRFAPPHLRSAALAALPFATREQLALAWAKEPQVSVGYAQSVAEELKARIGSTAGSDGQAHALLGELLDSLDRTAQDGLLEKLRAEGNANLAASLASESMLLTVPADALASALLAVPPDVLLGYARQAEPDLRERVLAGCPPRVRRELEEELALAAPSARSEFFDARRILLARVREELSLRSGGWQDPQTDERPRLVSTAE